MHSVLQFLMGKQWDWWVNQSGIILEIIGAGVLVVAAFRSRTAIKELKDVWKPSLPEVLRDTIANQALTELKGFVLLTAGLLLQMLSGFRP